MESGSDILLMFAVPVVLPFLPSAQIFWLYLLAAIGIAYALYRKASTGSQGRKDDAGSNRRFMDFCLPKSVYLHRSAIVDYKFYAINVIVTAFLMASLVGIGFFTADSTERMLSALFGGSERREGIGLEMRIAFTLSVLVAFDFGIFLVHFGLHRVPALWEFHKVHHSAEVLTPLTVYRVHPVDDLLYGLSTGVLTGIVQGAFTFAADGTVQAVQVLTVNASLFAFYLLGYNLRHSHLWLAYPKWLSRILISPAQHQIHHSSAPAHRDRNLGYLFAFWDGLANTLYVPDCRESLTYGLAGGEHVHYDGILALYVLPFRRVLGWIRRPAGGGR